MGTVEAWFLKIHLKTRFHSIYTSRSGNKGPLMADFALFFSQKNGLYFHATS